MPEEMVLTPEAQELEGKSLQELETILDKQEKEAAGTPAEKTASQAAETTSKPAEQEWQERLEQQQKTIENMQREMGRYRNLQSQYDKLSESLKPKPFDAANLTPEQRTQVDQLKEFIRSTVHEDSGPVIQQFKDMVAQQNYYTQVQNLCGTDFEALNPVMDKLIKQNMAQAYKNGDETAGAWIDTMLSNPSFLVLNALRQYAKDLEAQGGKVEQGRLAKAKAASSTLTTSPKPASKSSAEDYSEDELDKLSLEELEKMIPPAPSRGATI